MINKWLELILKERYGFDVILDKVKDSLELSLPSSDKKIIFTHLDPAFKKIGINDSIGLDWWSASSEGFEGAVEDALALPTSMGFKGPLVCIEGNIAYVSFDILGLAYWMMNRLEEIGNVPRDSHGRFKDENCHSVRYNYYLRPIVDEWLNILRQIMLRMWPGLEFKRHESSYFISHDIDLPSKYDFINWRNFAKSYAIAAANGGFRFREFLRRNPRSSCDLSVGDPFNTFDSLMDRSEKLGTKSAFYFICGGHSIYDATYKIDDPKIKTLLKHIHNRGHEIGLHASYKATEIKGAIGGEFQKLRTVCDELGITQEIWGGRTHYLRWKQPGTLREIEYAGLDYDSSLGYLRHVGFKCGTAFEYPAYDAGRGHEHGRGRGRGVGLERGIGFDVGAILNLRLRPLHVMDLNIHRVSGESELETVKKNTKLVGGVVGILIHNNRPKFIELIL